MGNERGWQSLVEQYLDACYQDLKNNYQQKSSNARAKVIEQHASSLIVDLYQKQVRKSLDSLNSYPPANSWKIEEETASRVVVEITKSKSFSIPFVSTRLLLVKPRESWQFHDILERCMRCSMGGKAIPGKCQLCRGTGKIIDESPCRYCEGTGACSVCRAESDAGWRRAGFLGRS